MKSALAEVRIRKENGFMDYGRNVNVVNSTDSLKDFKMFAFYSITF